MTWWTDLTAIATNAKDLITIVAGLGGGGFALYRYADEQEWKRRQFAFDYADAIFADPTCQLAMTMIDWYSSSALVPAGLAGNQGETISWGEGEVARALRVGKGPDLHNMTFSDKEYVIRGAFDGLLNRLERLSEFVKKGPLSKSDFPSSLRYYLERTKQRYDGLDEAFDAYVLHYKFGCTAWVSDKIVGPQPMDGPILKPPPDPGRDRHVS